MLIRKAGDAALLAEAGTDAAALAAAVRAARLAGVRDAIPGAATVLITTEPGGRDLDDLAGLIGALPRAGSGLAAGPPARLPVVYDGADLAEVARLAGLTPAGVIAAHQAAEYTVGWMGFSPGFGYLTGLDPALAAVPRLDRPRTSVPAGAVAIAGGLAAVYPAASPGGWRLLGRTSARLWDPRHDPPALLAPGLRVRFHAVAALPDEPAGQAAPAGEDIAGAKTGAARGGRAAGPSERGAPLAEVARPGPLATIQDLGRPGHGHLGVPASGAADPASLRQANLMAGNDPGAAGLELTLGRARLRFLASAVVAVTGAPAGLSADGVTAPFGAPFPVAAGTELRVAAPADGLRSYLAVSGGIGGPAVLGSRSSDLLSGLGPAPLRAGDLLFAADRPAGARPGTPSAAGPAPAPDTAPVPGTASVAAAVAGAGVPAGRPAVLRILPGPRADWFTPEALAALTGAEYTVTPASNRAGLRLDGPQLPRSRGGELPSEGLVTGALQVPPGGQPILMLADHPVTGGYPVIAVVRSADIGLAAQLRPGQRVRFTFGG